MDGPPVTFDLLVNRATTIRALFDTGCLCYSAVTPRLAQHAHLPIVPITPRRLSEATEKSLQTPNVVIKAMTYALIDIGGFPHVVYSYIIPGLQWDMILGEPWMRKLGIHYHAANRSITIDLAGGLKVMSEQALEEYEPYARIRRSTKMLGADAFYNAADRLRGHTDPGAAIGVCAVSLADINRALAPAPKRTQEEIEKMLPPEVRQYASLWGEDEARTLPPHREGADHTIPLITKEGQPAEVPWGPLYGMSREELLALRRTLAELLDQGWIRASSSPAGAPVLFVRKPNGGLRFCVDYRGLNAITQRDRYPLPLIKETLRNLTKARWFTKLDVRSAFHRIRMKAGEEFKTAFRTRYGLFEWMVMPMGLAGAPATFQRYVNQALGGLLDEICSAYVDDVLVYTTGSRDDHFAAVNKVLERLQQAGLQLDFHKCEFAVTEVKYLGVIITAGVGVKVDPEKLRAIRDWEPPTTVKGVRSFLGFANFHRDFIPNFAQIATPLTALIRKDAP